MTDLNNDKRLLKEAMDLLRLCTLIDRSGLCEELADRIETHLIKTHNND